MWLLLQSLMMFAVVASNIHWHWTPNGYLAGIGLDCGAVSDGRAEWFGRSAKELAHKSIQGVSSLMWLRSR
jgi:hypothetical protein